MNFHPEYKDKTKKGKKQKHKTECSALRRQHGCGICGSENIIIQGVKYCKICGTEIEILVLDDYWRWSIDVKVPCDCVKITIIKNKEHEYRQTGSIEIKKCLDCGAICSNFCPNCNSCSLWSGCWKLKDKYFCKRCGYRI